MTKSDLILKIQALETEKEEQEKILYSLKLMLWDRRSFEYTFFDISAEVKKLQEKIHQTEGREMQATRQFFEENEKLWGLLKLLVIPTEKLRELTTQDISRINQVNR